MVLKLIWNVSDLKRRSRNRAASNRRAASPCSEARQLELSKHEVHESGDDRQQEDVDDVEAERVPAEQAVEPGEEECLQRPLSRAPWLTARRG